MVLSLVCEGCQQPLHIQEELAGKRVKCPGCGHVQVAAAPGRPAAVAESPLPAPEPPPRLELAGPDDEIEDVLPAPGQEAIAPAPPPRQPPPPRRRRRRREEEDEDAIEVYCPHCDRLTAADEERCERCGEIIDDDEVEEMIEALKRERAFQNGMSFAFGVPGLLLGFVSAFALNAAEHGPSPTAVLIAVGLGLLGAVLLITGICFAAMYKGLHPAWALLGLLHLLGFIVLAVMPDQKGRRLLRLRNLLRERKALGW
jgi:ssDNA-binding Zn-finger/Zn-ribbon topoisomerase 1